MLPQRLFWHVPLKSLFEDLGPSILQLTKRPSSQPHSSGPRTFCELTSVISNNCCFSTVLQQTRPVTEKIGAAPWQRVTDETRSPSVQIFSIIASFCATAQWRRQISTTGNSNTSLPEMTGCSYPWWHRHSNIYACCTIKTARYIHCVSPIPLLAMAK